ncbi:chemotaxis protein CheA [Horticoccus luteus]|uniref:histidine kinase n=1 Tax=Horticoccus luteus TaxID=2862869 RepID=A0A8F9U007_9BACT|nr:chemotaxis protein CheA [Horticoccus luteus]QYM80642.1 chemotaxis protein CheA [Horticoccus luteus]
MSSDFSPELQAELLNDFYAEADEHLANLRAQLLILEGTVGETTPPPAVLESLFRSAHSFKGISAMVGLHHAEQLAHAAEGFLRQLTHGERSVDSAGVERLVGVTQRLEQMVAAHRLHQPPPAAADLLGQLAAVAASPAPARKSSSAAPAAPASVAPPPIEAAALAARGLQPWHVTFVPSRELDGRGININSVRARLAAAGEIASATPRVRPEGGIAFDFLVGLRQPPADLATWSNDGLTLHVVDLPAAPAHPPVPAEGADASSLFVAPSHVVRVELSRLDELMQLAGELVIQRSRLEERLNQFSGDLSGLKEVNQTMTRSLRRLRRALTRVRLVPVAEIFSRMPFVVRDLARESGVQVRLALEGQQTEIDKYLVERLKEPLLHLVRNAFSHGVELPAERIAAGKPAQATITLRATTAGEFVVLEIRDDGRGIDSARVADRARALGLAVPAALDDAALLSLLCTPGFSTREEADRASGRGVGMAVVHQTVRELGGTLAFTSTPGAGTCFALRLPLTLSIAETFVVSVGEQLCAVPQGFVEEVIEVTETEVRAIQQAEVVPYRDGVLPIVRLRALFRVAKSPQPRLAVLVLNSERGSTGLLVDRVHAQREVVVRPMHDPLVQVPGIAGATELGDGRPVLILDVAALTQGAVRPRPAVAAATAS